MTDLPWGTNQNLTDDYEYIEKNQNNGQENGLLAEREWILILNSYI